MIIVSLDIYNNKIVRLKNGIIDNINYYGYLYEYINFYNNVNIKKIHIVSLDNIFKNNKNIIKLKTNIKIQIGGGIKFFDNIKNYNASKKSFVLGSILINNKIEFKKILSFYKKKIIFSIDCKNNIFFINGWKTKTNYKLCDLINYLINIGIEKIIYTDVSKDGTLEGFDYINIKILSKYAFLCKLIISGGISNIMDTKKINKKFLCDFIIGISLYKFKIKISSLC